MRRPLGYFLAAVSAFCEARLVLRGAPTGTVAAPEQPRASGGRGVLSMGGLAPTDEAPGTRRTPRLYFLFMAIDQVLNFDIWLAFFEAAPREKYQAFIHCVKYSSCTSKVQGTPLILVPTVKTSYCIDLVSAQQQLLHYALLDTAGGVSHLDKFIFLSESTLPAKPFPVLYETLSRRPDSDICVFPLEGWKPVPDSLGFTAVKHHQWIVLNRVHARRAQEAWAEEKSRRFEVPNGCKDEFWYMKVLFGLQFVPHHGVRRMVNLDGYTGGPLEVADNTGIQGQCDTLALWASDWPTSSQGPMFKLYSSLDRQSRPRLVKESRPYLFEQLSSAGMRKLRTSPFLFVRKFIDHPKVVGDDAVARSGFVSAWRSLVLA